MLSVIILAAGKGTRMNDSNDPKVCRKVGNLSMIEHVINTSNQLKPENTIVIVSDENKNIINTLLKNDNIIYCIQKELTGTASAVLSAEQEYSNNNILVLLGDVPLIKYETLEKIRKSDNCCILGFNENNIQNKFGRIILNEENKIMKIVEYNDASEEERKITKVNSGTLYLNHKYTHFLREIKNENKKNEYYLTDIVEILTKNGIDIDYFEASKNECFGVNSPEDLKKVNEMIQIK